MCNVYLGKICAQMYTMKRRANEPTFRKMSENVLPPSLHPVSRIRLSRLNDFIVNAFLITLSGDMLAESLSIIEKIKLLKHCPVPDTFLLYSNVCKIIFFPVLKSFDYYKKNSPRPRIRIHLYNVKISKKNLLIEMRYDQIKRCCVRRVIECMNKHMVKEEKSSVKGFHKYLLKDYNSLESFGA